MTESEILNAITDNFLCVRRLPFEVISHWSYREGDETRKYVDSNGNPIKHKRTVVTREDGKKLVREERIVEKGGWWFVKEIKHTDATIRFDKNHDKFFAPTIGEAIESYLKSKS
jgi:hypothetical protein